MAQHDYNLINQTGASFRADLNNALVAIATNNAGASGPIIIHVQMDAPATLYYQCTAHAALNGTISIT
jgi:hypothetical protein